jgi:hypothetical protein
LRKRSFKNALVNTTLFLLALTDFRDRPQLIKFIPLNLDKFDADSVSQLKYQSDVIKMLAPYLNQRYVRQHVQAESSRDMILESETLAVLDSS